MDGKIKVEKIFDCTDYTLLTKQGEFVDKCIWSISTAGGSLNSFNKDAEIMLLSEKKENKYYHLLVDDSNGEQFIPCNDLSDKNQKILIAEYNLKSA